MRLPERVDYHLESEHFTHSIHQWSRYAPHSHSLTRSICQPFTSLNRSHSLTQSTCQPFMSLNRSHTLTPSISQPFTTHNRSLTELTTSIHHTQSSNLRKTSHSSAVVVNHSFFLSLLSYLEALRQKRDWQMTCRKMSHARPFNRHTKEYTYIIHTACWWHTKEYTYIIHTACVTQKNTFTSYTQRADDTQKNTLTSYTQRAWHIKVYTCIIHTACWWRTTNETRVHPNSKHWFTTSFLQPLPYLITPLGPENCQITSSFFVGAQAVVSSLQTTQIKQGVSFIAASKVYTTTNKTTIIWIETELFLSPGVDASHVYVRALALGCFYSHITTWTFRRALTASVDSCAEIKSACPFSDITNFGRVWRKVPVSDALNVVLPLTSSSARFAPAVPSSAQGLSAVSASQRAAPLQTWWAPWQAFSRC